MFLKNLSRAVGVELKPRGINVTCVCPGWVDTGMLPRTKDEKEINYGGMISVERKEILMRAKIETERVDLFDVNMMITMNVRINREVPFDALSTAFEKACKVHEVLNSKVSPLRRMPRQFMV